MAFNLTLKTGESFEWHIGSKKPLANFQFSNSKPFENVLYLAADGNELEHIGNKIRDLPIGYDHFIWRDSLAQLIYDNL